MNPVALVAPYQRMAEMAREICREFEKPVTIELGDLQEGLNQSRKLIGHGTEVIISRGGTARLLKEQLALPVVEIKVTAYDILKALQKIPRRGKKIGIIGFGNVIYGAEALGDLLNLNLTTFTIQKEEDVPIKLEEARKENVEIIVGDMVVVSHAKRMGYESILIESGKESILQSFHEAYKILEVVRSEAKKSREYLTTLNQLQAVLDSVDDQVIILDERGRIQSCNPAALRIFGKREEELRGLPLHPYPTDPLNEMEKSRVKRNYLAHVQGKHILLDYIPIERDGDKSGTLIIGRSVAKLQQAERKVRHELYLKGHVARYTFDDIIGEDPDFQKVIKKARSFSSSASTVLISGETGTGKEMFAQSIHNEKFGPERPFVAINCATLPEPLLESELFGYAPGAFTGARKEGKKGLFELAHEGTLLLDEISELPINLQSRLLRVIEERKVLPIGDDRAIPVDVRIIATANKDLAREVKEKRFRGDLFYRLDVLHLDVPPLRKRGKDFMELFKRFVLKVNPECPKKHLFNRQVENLLARHTWAGNVRELKNLVERLSILTDHFTASLTNILQWIAEELKKPEEFEGLEEAPKGTALNLREMQEAWVKEICESSPLKRTELARLLGISRTTLWKRMKRPGDRSG
jgi:PAS domain S-box-containing protein